MQNLNPKATFDNAANFDKLSSKLVKWRRAKTAVIGDSICIYK